MKSLATYYFLWYLAISVVMPYTSLYFSDRGFSHTTVGLILSLWALVSVIAQPVMGMINDRINNPRKIIMICVIIAPILGLGFQLMEGLPGILFLSIFFAWFQSSGGPIGDAMSVEIASKKVFLWQRQVMGSFKLCDRYLCYRHFIRKIRLQRYLYLLSYCEYNRLLGAHAASSNEGYS